MYREEDRILPRSFYLRPPDEVARGLLGKYLVRVMGGQRMAGRIIETEAYLSEGDLAAHGAVGYKERTKSLFGEGGHAYVHVSRHHVLMDIVAQEAGVSGSVLLRALEPLEGLECMQKNRGTTQHIANGPGKLCQALQITLRHDGVDVTQPGELYVVALEPDIPSEEIEASPRIGLGKSKELPLRFTIKGHPDLSR